MIRVLEINLNLKFMSEESFESSKFKEGKALEKQETKNFISNAIEFAKTIPHEGRGWFCGKCGEIDAEGHPCKPTVKCEYNGFDYAFMANCSGGKKFFAAPTAYTGREIRALEVDGVRFESWRYERVGRTSGGEIEDELISSQEASHDFPICVGDTIWVKGKQFNLPDPEEYSSMLPKTWVETDHGHYDRDKKVYPHIWTDHARMRFLQEAWDEETRKSQEKGVVGQED